MKQQKMRKEIHLSIIRYVCVFYLCIRYYCRCQHQSVVFITRKFIKLFYRKAKNIYKMYTKKIFLKWIKKKNENQ